MQVMSSFLGKTVIGTAGASGVCCLAEVTGILPKDIATWPAYVVMGVALAIALWLLDRQGERNAKALQSQLADGQALHQSTISEIQKGNERIVSALGVLAEKMESRNELDIKRDIRGEQMQRDLEKIAR